MTTHVLPAVRALRGAGVLLALMTFGGCGLFGPDGDLYAGVVVVRETGLPVEGIHVSIQRSSSFAGYHIVAEAMTDSAGRFRMRSSDGAIFVNDPPCYFSTPCSYNPRYSSGLAFIGNSDRTRIRIEIVDRGAPPARP